VCVRLAEHDDLPAILAISNHYVVNSTCNFAIEPESLEAWRADFESEHETYPWFVAVDEAIPPSSQGEEGEKPDPRPQPLSGGSRGERGVVVGFAKAAPYHGRCAYSYAVEITVYVHPDYHGRGIGKALYGRLLSTLKAQGYHAVIAAISQPNPVSVNLHESLGLSHAGTFRQVGRKFGRWHDVGYWYATLQDEEHEPQTIRPVCEVLRENEESG
jgi:phosphinothricin acetyltransferase